MARKEEAKRISDGMAERVRLHEARRKQIVDGWRYGATKKKLQPSTLRITEIMEALQKKKKGLKKDDALIVFIDGRLTAFKQAQVIIEDEASK